MTSMTCTSWRKIIGLRVGIQVVLEVLWTGTPVCMGAAGLLDHRRLLTLLMVGAVVLSVSGIDWGSPLFHTGGGGAARDFLSALFPPELSPSFLVLALAASWQTLAFAVAGITLAIVLGLPLGVIASGSVFGSGRSSIAPIAAARFFLAAIRSIHELVWAVLFWLPLVFRL